MTLATAPPPADAPSDVAHELDISPVDAEDPQAVPTTLASLVMAAHAAVRVIEVNACYSPQEAVSAVEATTAVLHRLAAHVEPYVGDYSALAATSTCQARDALGQARSALSDARHHLVLDETASSAKPLV